DPDRQRVLAARADEDLEAPAPRLAVPADQRLEARLGARPSRLASIAAGPRTPRRLVPDPDGVAQDLGHDDRLAVRLAPLEPPAVAIHPRAQQRGLSERDRPAAVVS